jgi:hypothetical protein
MTTDELFQALPSHIGRNKVNGFYLSDNKRGADVGWLYLVNDGKHWVASYGPEGDFVCLNPDAEKPPYNNAVYIGKTPNEALQGLYDWCVENGFIK